MLKLNLREFANLPEEIILRWRGSRLKVEVTDDFKATKLTDTYDLMLSWYGLGIHRQFNGEKYAIDEIVDCKVYNEESLAEPINRFLNRIMVTMYSPLQSDLIKRLIYVWQCKLNNFLVVMTEGYAISADAECVAELMDDPGIVAIRERVTNLEISIDEGEVEFIAYMESSPTLDYNTFALLARTGGVAYNMAYQTTICRGAVFDLNNQIFPNAIHDSYGTGITNLADSLAEIKGAGKSLITNGKALKDSEWFHRKTHLYMATITAIDHEHDCGSPHTVPLKVLGKDFANSLQGKYMMTEEKGLVLITRDVAKTLVVGDTVNIRSQAFCMNQDASAPCRVCYGMMKTAVPYNVIMRRDANIGMFSGTTVCNPMGQKMLSTKHFLRNTTTQPFKVMRADADVITTNGDDIFLNKELCRPGTELILPVAVVRELSDLRSLDTLENVSADKLTFFNDVTFKYTMEDPMIGGTTTHQKSVATSVSSRSAKMSTDFLEYVLLHGWKVQDKKFISVELGGWNYKAPLFALPYMHEDLDVHRRRIESFLTFSNRNITWKKQEVTPKLFGEVLSEFWQLMAQKFKGNNIIHLETMLYATTASDPFNGCYALVNGRGIKYFTSFVNCINNRGAGTMLIFERQQTYLNDPRSFLVKDRQGSPLECFWGLAAN